MIRSAFAVMNNPNVESGALGSAVPECAVTVFIVFIVTTMIAVDIIRVWLRSVVCTESVT